MADSNADVPSITCTPNGPYRVANLPALRNSRGEDLPVRAPFRLTIDYHTAQSPPRMRNRRFATRREELAVKDLGTILTRREYRAHDQPGC